MDDYLYYIIVLIVAAGLGLIPASIARNKGYNFGLWWFYGWMIFIVAIIHVSLIRDKKAQQFKVYAPPAPYSPPYASGQSVADELKKYKELKNQGIITEEEFRIKKEQLLKLL